MRIRILASALALSMVAAACSSDDPAPSASTSSTTGSPAATGDPGEALNRYAEHGPFAVGFTTIQPADRPIDIWYPAADGATGERVVTDVRRILPEEFQAFVPDDVSPEIEIDALVEPAPSDRGPFPVVAYSHGFSSYRTESATHLAHLASWGMVVVAPQHLERDLLAVTLGQTSEVRDVQDLRDAIEAAIGLEGALAGLVDGQQIGVVGLSAGGRAALEFAAQPDVDVVVARAPAGPDDLRALSLPAMIIVSDGDIVVPPERSKTVFEQLAPPRALAVLNDAGHATYVDICPRIRDQGGLAAVAEELNLPQLIVDLGENGCLPEFPEPELAWDMIDHLSTAWLLAAFGTEVGNALDAELLLAEEPDRFDSITIERA